MSSERRYHGVAAAFCIFVAALLVILWMFVSGDGQASVRLSAAGPQAEVRLYEDREDRLVAVLIPPDLAETRVKPGRYRVQVTASDARVVADVRWIDVSAGDRREIHLAIDESAPPLVTPAPPSVAAVPVVPAPLALRGGKLPPAKAQPIADRDWNEALDEQAWAESFVPKSHGIGAATTEPIYPAALVSKPLRLPGLRSWTLEQSVISAASGGERQIDDAGRYFAELVSGKPLKIYDLDSGELAAVLPRIAEGELHALRFTPHETTLSVADGNYVQIWNWRTATLKAKAPARGQVEATDMSRRTDSIAIACNNHLIVWNVIRDRQQFTTPFPACALKFSPDGKWLAAISAQGQLGVWDTNLWETELAVRTDVKYTPPQPLQILWLSNEVFVVNDGRAALSRFDAVERKILQPLPIPEPCLFCGAICETTSGLPQQLVGVHAQGSMLLELDGTVQKQFTRNVNDRPIALSLDARTLLTQNAGKYLVWSTQDGTQHSFIGMRQDAVPSTCHWAPNGRHLALRLFSPQLGAIACVVNVSTGRTLHTFEQPRSPQVDGYPAWSRDGKRFFTGWTLHEMPSGNEIALPRVAGAATMSPDLTHLAGVHNGKLAIIDVATGQSRPLPALASTFYKFSPDGELLAVVGGRESQVFRTRDLSLVARFEVGGFGVAWSPSGKYLLLDRSAYNVEDHSVGFVLPKNVPGYSVSWSPDGEFLAAGGGYLRSRYEARELPPPAPVGRAQLLVWHPSSRCVASPESTSVAIYAIPGGDLQARIVPSPEGPVYLISPTGDFLGPAQGPAPFQVLTEDEAGEYALWSVEAFQNKYGWRNNPQQIWAK